MTLSSTSPTLAHGGALVAFGSPSGEWALSIGRNGQWGRVGERGAS